MLYLVNKFQCMKGGCLWVSALLFCTTLKAQQHIPHSPEAWVRYCDSLSVHTQTTFHLVKEYNGHPVKESWHYAMVNGQIVFFQVSYSFGHREMNEVYYVKGGRLICMEIFEAAFHPVYEDNVKRGEVYYFDGGRVIRAVKLGEPFTRREEEYALWKKFSSRYGELLKNLRW